jgi:hypothetical protein
LILTAIVAWMFADIGRYWPLGTAVAVVVCVGAGIAVFAFGHVKSWKLIAWVAFVFLGSLVSIRYARAFAHGNDTNIRAVEAVVHLAGALLAGTAALVLLWLIPDEAPNIVSEKLARLFRPRHSETVSADGCSHAIENEPMEGATDE